ncbi:Hypothetical protein A7982_09047 [Minicystis rosea]|nr:Hypothetical protein A7982_09047 [Minicystis rosea]
MTVCVTTSTLHGLSLARLGTTMKPVTLLHALTRRLLTIPRRARLSLGALAMAALAAAAVSLAAPSALANLYDRLPARSRAALDRGAQVVRTQEMEGSKWPAVTVYQLVAVPPEVAMAVFTDFGGQAAYLKDCCGLLQSIVKDPAVDGDPRVQRVFYEIAVPVFSNEQYELLETLAKNTDGSYSVTWRKIGTGGHSDDIVGQAIFEPQGDGTLLYYNNFVKMNAVGAGLFAGRSVDATKTTIRAMARNMEERYAAGGRRLRDDLARLRAAFAQ